MAFEAYYRPPGALVMAGATPSTLKKAVSGSGTCPTCGGNVNAGGFSIPSPGAGGGSGMPPVTTSWPGTDPSGSSTSTIVFDPVTDSYIGE